MHRRATEAKSTDVIHFVSSSESDLPLEARRAADALARPSANSRLADGRAPGSSAVAAHPSEHGNRRGPDGRLVRCRRRPANRDGPRGLELDRRACTSTPDDFANPPEFRINAQAFVCNEKCTESPHLLRAGWRFRDCRSRPAMACTNRALLFSAAPRCCFEPPSATSVCDPSQADDKMRGWRHSPLFT